MRTAEPPTATFLDMNRTQWIVILAAWLGWGFDCFDAILFTYVAPTCVPTLLGLEIGSQDAKTATLYWNGVFTSLLLVGWAVGGILFGRVADRIGRTRTLLLTMALYSLGTAACSVAPNLAVLALFRVVASLGIGGEWAAGAAMVAEVVPERRRLEAGALLYTAAPLGLFLATYVTWQIQGVALAGSPETSWRFVFLCGLVPAAVAFLVRWFVEEPARWKNIHEVATPRMRDLFSPQYRSITLSGLGMATVSLLMWWSCSAFIPIVATGLASAAAAADGLDRIATTALTEEWKATANNSFNLGGILGTLLTVPVAKTLGRRAMFGLYFVLAATSIWVTFGLDLSPRTILLMYFPIGLTVFGVFGSFTYYLPELFPTRLRGTGAGFCYNAGRLIAAIGPFVVGRVASLGADALESALHALFWVGFVPAAGLLLLPLVVETRDRTLED